MLRASGTQSAPGRRNAVVYNSSQFDPSGAPTPSMLSFIRLLKQRYDSVLRHLPEAEERRRPELRRVSESLAFAEAFLEKGELIRSRPEHALQVAILGPTQTGKSSVTNWLLGQQRAVVSPLAGFTVHPQGFALDLEDAELDWLQGYFRHYRRESRAALSPDRFDAYLLEAVTLADPRHPLHRSIVWDTPDFDSVDADAYRQAVFRVAALADLVLLIVSKDKYADLSVWELMRLLAPLGQPTVICLNKVDPDARQALPDSLREKWRAIRADPPPPIITLPYLEEADGLAGLAAERRRLLEELESARCKVQRERHSEQARRLIDAHWQRWVGPVEAEHRLQLEWREIVAAAVKDSLATFRRDYLDHPQHYETFQRALAELVTLLEVPGIGGALLTARKAVTWPVRQIQKLGRSVGGRAEGLTGGAEQVILRQQAEHAFIGISENLLLRSAEDAAEQSWWRELGGLLRAERPIVLERFAHRAEEYQSTFQPEIERTARRLYEHLRDHPAVLNSLRATRVTTDAAALALALHTGGIGLQDFIIAPAILSLTTLLAEGALGRYMERAAADLKARQAAAVEKLFRETIAAPLLRLPERLETARRFDISPESLAAAEALRH